MSINELTVADWAVLRRLRLAALHEEYRDSPVYELEVGFDERRWRARAREHTHFMCLLDTVPTGLIAAAPATDGEVYVYSLWIDPAARGRRLGAPLVDAVLTWARERGAHTVTLRVHRHNVPARRIYEAAGFIACTACPDDGGASIDMTLRLPPPPANQSGHSAANRMNTQASAT